MIIHKKFSFSRFQISFAKLTIILFSTYLTVACTSTKGPSINHSQKLASGIQSAFSVSPTTANRVAPIILQTAEHHNISPHLLAALIRQESSYRTLARSSADAVGLTQVRPKFWQQYCPGDLYDEHVNINCGAYILANYYQSTGDWSKALGYYNVGPTGYRRSPYMRQQAERYASSVKRHEQSLKEAL
ncbi:Transglycosylase [Acinetobacter proteolyticus]|uniref:Transglycosylase n=1 Tax=Acinetobacter proteolyticus TaxID=1776741 RepID=A0A653K6K0_9GAMM|nr:transglycosylase SLT domain-containing protein [Acinetobacter proteolyticus]VXA56512.1 Transglycosylase [Acinetobacter proteolyticus]